MKVYPRFIVLIALFALSSCKKGSDVIVIDPQISSASPSLQIKIDSVINDSTIVLKWTKPTRGNFVSYTLSRYGSVLVNGKVISVSTVLKAFTSVDSLQYIENKMPFGGDITYVINVTTDNVKNNAYSSVVYSRPNALRQLSLFDVLINDQKKYLYVYDASGHIILIDYTNNKQLASVDMKINIGYCALGDYQGVKNELYVPTSDGWLDILDAATLQIKDRIYVTGTLVASVIANNGQLYVSSTDGSFSITGYDNQLKVYNRQTKAVISRSGYLNDTRLLYLQTSGTELVDLPLNSSPPQLGYYKFDSNGKFQTEIKDPYFDVYTYDYNIFRSFPDGSKFITGPGGVIFNKNITYDRTVNVNAAYTDFAFNTDGSVIYGAVGNSIQAISYPSLNLIKSYSTTLNPFRIFRDGNTLIMISTSGFFRPSLYPPSASAYFILEKINL